MSEKFLFEIFTMTGQRVMHTEHPDAMYPDDELKEMQKAGYKLKKNGKVYRPK